MVNVELCVCWPSSKCSNVGLKPPNRPPVIPAEPEPESPTVRERLPLKPLMGLTETMKVALLPWLIDCKAGLMVTSMSGLVFPPEVYGPKIATAAAQFSAAFNVKAPLYAPIVDANCVSFAARDADV